MLLGEPDVETLARSACRRSWSRSAPRARSSSPTAGSTRVPARPVGGEIDPTGAGDAFSAAYLVSRSSGYAPVAGCAPRDRGRRTTCSAGGSREGARAHGGRRLRGRPRGGAGARARPREAVEPQEVPLSLPLRRRRGGVGSTVIAVVDRRPPLAVSNDAGRTWREAGGGLPPGRAIAIAEDDPDHVVYAARNRLYLSRNGGVFWRALDARAPRDRGGRAQGSLNSPRATITALPPTSTRSIASAVPSARAYSVDGPPDLDALRDLDLLAEADAAVAREVHRERPGGRAGGRVLGDAAAPARTCAPSTACPRPGEAVDAEQPRQLEQRRDVRPQRRDLLRRAERRRRRAARRCRTARPAAPTARPRAPPSSASASAYGSHVGSGWRHPPEDDPVALALERDRHDARRRSRAGSPRAAAAARARTPCRASDARRTAARRSA